MTKHRISSDSLSEQINGFESISLENLKNAELLDRKEVKYVFERDLLDRILEELPDHYFILEIDGKRQFKYLSQYFDTDDLQFFHRHRTGRLNRYKVRKREYLDAGLAFFEVKFKNNHGRTIKSRIPTETQTQEEILQEEDSFLQEVSPFLADALNPTVSVLYNRLTLVNKNSPERVTIDMNLNLQIDDHESTFDDLVILEVKQDRLRASKIKSVLRGFGIRPGTISKYCLGIISNEDDVRYNRFKPRFDRLYKPFLNQ
ncbi:polyphosphate polymerase domain-containing protein [Jiulongibacter sp. NS-SX5]|uniref:polyphosphate polymerase domain-containing protein n=1 Tax=Jiulongibacter sp. NS-SX5 TaxID=3463854 RepID=UPI0040589C56